MTLATQTPVTISNQDFTCMLNFAKAVYQLKSNTKYIEKFDSELPETAQIISNQPSLLMGYDFHLTSEKPQLIEINNNAGGLFEVEDGWIPQQVNLPQMPKTLASRLQSMFAPEWQHIAIMDEDIKNQYMYPEMLAYAELLKHGRQHVSLVSPEGLILQNDGLYANGIKVDAIYNRHTDFYLGSLSMQHIRRAFMEKQVLLNPYPRSYALIGDKNRMVDWWRSGLLEACIDEATVDLIHSMVPETHLLSEYDKDQAWSERKTWVFKPAARHGGKGVLLGKAMSRKRFEALDAQNTVMQKLVPPSHIKINDQTFKFDIRLYMCGEKLIAMAGRAWNGQITNFRESGSGWTSIEVNF